MYRLLSKSKNETTILMAMNFFPNFVNSYYYSLWRKYETEGNSTKTNLSPVTVKSAITNTLFSLGNSKNIIT